jgi:predicted phosphate transport protein (TIGR00153 family)
MALFGRRRNSRVFYDLFEEAGANVARSGELLERLLKRWPEPGELGREIHTCEQEGDRITHDIIHRVNTVGRGPFDREDLFALATALDDIVDYAEETADFLGLYSVEAPMEQALELAGILREASRNVAAALARLPDVNSLNSYLIEIKRLENEGDRVMREAVASLFDGGIDPIVIIRWKDIFERLEAAVDACEHVAHVLEGIVVKSH